MIAPPALPVPPESYDARYISQLLRILTLFFNRVTAPDVLQAHTAVFTGLPTSPAGLAEGALWVDGDVVRVVTPGWAYPAGQTVVTEVGTITAVVS